MDMFMSSNIGSITKALLAAQKQMGNAVKDAKNPFYRSSYADLNAVREACTPLLNANDIVVTQPLIQKDGKSYLRTLLLHTSGEYLGSDVEIVCAKQNDPQAQGSAISYARRYGLQSLMSLGAADDDGEGAMGRTKKYTAIKTNTPNVEVTYTASTPTGGPTTLHNNTVQIGGSMLGTVTSSMKTDETTTSTVSTFRKPKSTAKQATQVQQNEHGANSTKVEGWE